MGPCPPGSRTSPHAARQYYSRPRATFGPAAWCLGSYFLDDPAIAPGTAQTMPARNRKPRPDGQPLFLKTEASHFSFALLTARQATMKLSRGDVAVDLAVVKAIPWFHPIVNSVIGRGGSKFRFAQLRQLWTHAA